MPKLVTTLYSISFDNLPPAFDGYTIAHVSDLHNTPFIEKLTTRIKAASPDIIAVTGDMIHLEYRMEHAVNFFEEAVKIAPVYYVAGNHESVLKSYTDLEQIMTRLGVKILKNEYLTIKKGDDTILLLGMNDPTFFDVPEGYDKNSKESGRSTYKANKVSKAEIKPAGLGRKAAFKEKLSQLNKDAGDGFKILLSHRPEIMQWYFDENIDLTLAGHSHGGQVRLPFIGPLYAPNQGTFPKLVDGVKEENGKKLVISRGLGNSNRFPRINNPRELVIISLRK